MNDNVYEVYSVYGYSDMDGKKLLSCTILANSY